MLHCPICGKENKDMAKFCAGCGSPLMQAQPQARAQAASQQSQGYDDEDDDIEFWDEEDDAPAQQAAQPRTAYQAQPQARAQAGYPGQQGYAAQGGYQAQPQARAQADYPGQQAGAQARTQQRAQAGAQAGAQQRRAQAGAQARPQQRPQAGAQQRRAQGQAQQARPQQRPAQKRKAQKGFPLISSIITGVGVLLMILTLFLPLINVKFVGGYSVLAIKGDMDLLYELGGSDGEIVGTILIGVVVFFIVQSLLILLFKVLRLRVVSIVFASLQIFGALLWLAFVGILMGMIPLVTIGLSSILGFLTSIVILVGCCLTM